MKRKTIRFLAILLGLLFALAVFLATDLAPGSTDAKLVMGLTVLSLNFSSIGVFIVFLITRKDE